MDSGIKFEKSKAKGKKYAAILPDGKRVNFGALGYEHYKDRTPLKLYSHLDHNDPERRKNIMKDIIKIIQHIVLITFLKNIYGNITKCLNLLIKNYMKKS